MTTRSCDSSPSFVRGHSHIGLAPPFPRRLARLCTYVTALALLAALASAPASAVRFSRLETPRETDTIDDPEPTARSDRMEWGRLMREARDELRRKQFSAAEADLLEALAIADHHGPPDQRAATTLFYLDQVAEAYLAAGRFSDHARVTPEIILRMDSLTGNQDAALRAHRQALAQSFAKTNQFESARQLVDSLLEDPATDEPLRTSLRLQRASLSLGAGDLDRAQEDVDAASAALAASESIDPLPQLEAQRLRGQLLVRQKQPDEAENAFREALARAATDAPGSLTAALTMGDLASLYLGQNRNEEALTLARASVQILEGQRAELHRQVESLELLAAVLVALGRDEEAQSAFERALHRGADLPDTSASVRERYIGWLKNRGREDDAAAVEATQRPTPAAAGEPASLSLPSD